MNQQKITNILLALILILQATPVLNEISKVFSQNKKLVERTEDSEMALTANDISLLHYDIVHNPSSQNIEMSIYNGLDFRIKSLDVKVVNSELNEERVYRSNISVDPKSSDRTYVRLGNMKFSQNQERNLQFTITGGIKVK